MQHGPNLAPPTLHIMTIVINSSLVYNLKWPLHVHMADFMPGPLITWERMCKSRFKVQDSWTLNLEILSPLVHEYLCLLTAANLGRPHVKSCNFRTASKPCARESVFKYWYTNQKHNFYKVRDICISTLEEIHWKMWRGHNIHWPKIHTFVPKLIFCTACFDTCFSQMQWQLKPDLE